jgi:hypothetical protein
VPTRADIIDALRGATEALPEARAGWLGGSDATGRTDALSDVDLVVAATDSGVEAVFGAVERALEALGGVELRLDVPKPTWHGHDQRFYRVKGAPVECMVDVVVMKTSAPEGSRFLEPERHGAPAVLFDKDAWIAPAPLDRFTHVAKMWERLEALKTRFAMFQPLITKALARGQPVDAVAFYHGFALQPVVEVLRMLHCPDRYDFGMRYLGDDLPAEAAARVQRLCYYSSPEILHLRRREAEELFWATVRKLESPSESGAASAACGAI